MRPICPLCPKAGPMYILQAPGANPVYVLEAPKQVLFTYFQRTSYLDASSSKQGPFLCALGVSINGGIDSHMQ